MTCVKVRLTKKRQTTFSSSASGYPSELYTSTARCGHPETRAITAKPGKTTSHTYLNTPKQSPFLLLAIECQSAFLHLSKWITTYSGNQRAVRKSSKMKPKALGESSCLGTRVFAATEPITPASPATHGMLQCALASPAHNEKAELILRFPLAQVT